MQSFLNHVSWCFLILPLLSIQTGSFRTAQRTELSREQVHFVVGSINHSSPGWRIRCSLSSQTMNTLVSGNMEHWISNSAVHEHWLSGVGFQTSPTLWDLPSDPWQCLDNVTAWKNDAGYYIKQTRQKWQRSVSVKNSHIQYYTHWNVIFHWPSYKMTRLWWHYKERQDPFRELKQQRTVTTATKTSLMKWIRAAFKNYRVLLAVHFVKCWHLFQGWILKDFYLVQEKKTKFVLHKTWKWAFSRRYCAVTAKKF